MKNTVTEVNYFMHCLQVESLTQDEVRAYVA